MKLVSVDGATVDLRPLHYQFPGTAAAGQYDWDANWLVVRGGVRLPDGRTWSFSDPCLTTWEARSLGDWLRGVVAGEEIFHEASDRVLSKIGRDVADAQAA